MQAKAIGGAFVELHASRESSGSRPPSWRPSGAKTPNSQHQPPSSLAHRTRSAIYSSPRKGAVHFLLPDEDAESGAQSTQDAPVGQPGEPANHVTAVLENAPNISPGKVETRLTLLSSPGEPPCLTLP